MEAQKTQSCNLSDRACLGLSNLIHLIGLAIGEFLKPIDIIILVVVALLLFLVIYYRFIKNKNLDIAGCAKVDKYKLNKIRSYYEK